ncbi:MAG: hypothetical protein J7J80_05320 [Thermotogae bacterium]|nr:hypothetical protein [Thermotogota bacterium]
MKTSLRVNLYQHKVRKLKLQTFLILLGSLVIAGLSLNYLFSTYLYLTQSSIVKKEFPVIAKLGVNISGDVSKTLERVKSRSDQLKRENQKLQKQLTNAKNFLNTEMVEHDYFTLLSEFGEKFNGERYVLKSLVYSPTELTLSLWEITETQPMAERLLQVLAAKHKMILTRNAYNQYSLGRLKVIELSVSLKR